MRTSGPIHVYDIAVQYTAVTQAYAIVMPWNIKGFDGCI